MAGTKHLAERQKGLKKALLISRIQRGTAGFKGRRFRFFIGVGSQPSNERFDLGLRTEVV